VWTEEERKKGQAWGLKTIESFHTTARPPVVTDGLDQRSLLVRLRALSAPIAKLAALLPPRLPHPPAAILVSSSCDFQVCCFAKRPANAFLIRNALAALTDKTAEMHLVVVCRADADIVPRVIRG